MLDKRNAATALSRLSYIYVRYMKAIPSHEPNNLTNISGYSYNLNTYYIYVRNWLGCLVVNRKAVCAGASPHRVV